MKKLCGIPVVLALALVVAAPVSAATTPNAILKSQLRVQKAKVAKLKSELAGARTTITTLNGQVATLTSQASATAILSSGKDATIAGLQTQNATLTQGGLAAVLAGSPTDLWNAIAAIYPLMPHSSGCGLSKSYYASAPYFNYSFTNFGC